MYRHEIPVEDQYGMWCILSGNDGFYLGTVDIEPPIRPEMGLGATIDQQNEAFRRFKKDILEEVVAKYGALTDRTMAYVARIYAHLRNPTIEEMEHDMDHFGVEQILWPKDYYSERTGIPIDKIDPDIPTYKFHKNSFMRGEEWIYVAPKRLVRATYGLFVDSYPLRTSTDFMVNVVEGLKPDYEGAQGHAYEIGIFKKGVGLSATLHKADDEPDLTTKVRKELPKELARMEKEIDGHLNKDPDRTMQHLALIKQGLHEVIPLDIQRACEHPEDHWRDAILKEFSWYKERSIIEASKENPKADDHA